MKDTIYSLIAMLFIVFSIGGCESSTSTAGSFEPYTIGTWEIINDSTAHWIGGNKNLKSMSESQSVKDTVFIIEPGLRLQYKQQLEDELSLRYTDSKIAEIMLDTLEIGNFMILDTPLGSIQDSAIFVPTMSIGGGLPFDCDSTYSKEEIIHISFMKKGWQNGDPVNNESVVEDREIPVDGLYQTGTDLFCQ